MSESKRPSKRAQAWAELAGEVAAILLGALIVALGWTDFGVGLMVIGAIGFVITPPTDFLPGSIARINPAPQWNGRHFCSLDWHVISVALIEGNPVGGSVTNQEIFDALSQRVPFMTLDGALLDTERTANKRTTNPENRGFVEAFSVSIGKVMAPEDLAVGQHSLQLTACVLDSRPCP